MTTTLCCDHAQVAVEVHDIDFRLSRIQTLLKRHGSACVVFWKKKWRFFFLPPALSVSPPTFAKCARTTWCVHPHALCFDSRRLGIVWLCQGFGYTHNGKRRSGTWTCWCVYPRISTFTTSMLRGNCQARLERERARERERELY
jgi:hypothetical protein